MYQLEWRLRTGFNFISLIIGMVLSSFLILGIMQIFVASKVSAKNLQNVEELQSAMHYAVSRMTAVIGMAGYRFPTATGMQELPVALGSFLSCNGCHIYPAVNGSTDGQQDTPVVAMQGDGLATTGITSCNGTVIPEGNTAYLKFHVSSNGSGGLNLQCSDVDSNNTTLATTTLVNDVVYGMWVKYGYDNDNDKSVNYYTIDATTPTVTSTTIRAVRIILILRSKDEILPVAQVQKFYKWGIAVSIPSSKYLYMMHTVTIPLLQIT